ncbi:hypothetical protein H0H93_006012 [Arthromyces matolae]|nr:hypothetical protein H0H93_006012 [Arthromyces matolae]
MKSILQGAVTVLHASILLHYLMTPMVVAAPATLGNNVDHSRASRLYAESSANATPKLSRPVLSDNAIAVQDPSKAPHLPVEVEMISTLEMIVQTVNRGSQPKQDIPPLLERLAADLTTANQQNAPYPRIYIYNTIKYLLVGVLKKWPRSKVRRKMVMSSMKCLQQTKPPGLFAELPYELDLKDLSWRIENDTALKDRSTWKGLMDFLLELQWTLLQAQEQDFSYDKLVLDEALMNSRNAAEKWVKGINKNDILLLMDTCLALIWVGKEHPAAALTATVHLPSMVLKRTCTNQNDHLPSSTPTPQSYAERRMSGLLENPENLGNIFILPWVMEVVPDDACIRREAEWTISLVVMRSCVESYGEGPSRAWALRRIDTAYATLRQKVGKAKEMGR